MIDYSLLAKAQNFYQSLGYKYIEVPWYVSEEIKDITRPFNKDPNLDYKLSANNKFLVASGEQGFLYLYTKGFLPSGKYCTITPCFRYEEINLLHKKVFMKCELIHILDQENAVDATEAVLKDAIAFYTSIGLKPERNDLEYFSLKNIDLEVNNIELGSYGYREYGNIRWIYGTGCAEPRTSYLISIKDK